MGSFAKLLLALLMVQAASAELTNGLYAAFDTSMGSFTCRLDYAEAPLTCANFVGLAEGSQHWTSTDGAVLSAPFYGGLIFHRVIDGFMIQGGCPLGNGTSGPGYAFPDEISTNLTHDSAGVLSMANSGDNSNGSQFFITLGPTSWLDGDHSIFGEVVEGMNIITDIGSVATDADDRPLTNVVMNSIQVLRVGPEAEAFDPLDQPLPEVTPLSLTLSENVSAVTSNQCEQFIFTSENLINWTESIADYSPTAGVDISLEVPTNQACGYYRGVKIFHPQASTSFSNLEGRTVVYTQGTNTFTFALGADGLGTCNIAGTADTLTFWEEWTSEPYVARVVFQPSSMYAFQFVWSRSGDCEGYQYSAFGWQYIGLWAFDEGDIIPE